MYLIIILFLIFAYLFCLSYLLIKIYNEKYSYKGSNIIGVYGLEPTKHIANVPLTPLKSAFELLKTTETVPNFLIYKTEILTPVQEQGICGSCWAFSICSILSDRSSVLTNGIFKEQLSVQQLLSCFGKDSGCYGESPEDALLWIEKNQYKLENNYLLPYEQDKSFVINTICPVKNVGITVLKNSIKSLTVFIDEHKYDKNILEKNIKNMKTELLIGGPFIATITIYKDFFTYNGLQIYYSNKKEEILGGHAIEIVGYCDKDIDKRIGFQEGYWICRNSWGSDWPTAGKDKGYFAILMGSNECGIESRCCKADPLLKTKIFANRNKSMYTSYNTFLKHLKGFYTTKQNIEDEDNVQVHNKNILF